MRSFEEWLRDTEIEPKYEERTPMEIAYEAGLREGIGDGSKVPCSDRVMRKKYIRKQAIFTLELTKGHTPEQREDYSNAMRTAEEFANYILELTD